MSAGLRTLTAGSACAHAGCRLLPRGARWPSQALARRATRGRAGAWSQAACTRQEKALVLVLVLVLMLVQARTLVLVLVLTWTCHWSTSHVRVQKWYLGSVRGTKFSSHPLSFLYGKH